MGAYTGKPLKFWLISYKTDDPGSEARSSGWATHRDSIKLFFVHTFILVTVFSFGIFLFPPQAHASILSFLGSIFNGEDDTTLTAQSFNSQTISLLQPALNVDPNPSKGGGDITIVGDTALLPDVGPLGTIADVSDYSSKTGEINVYVVRSGDTLSQIAEMFNVSVNTILWANNLSRGAPIRNGQTLIILPISGVRYTVKKGDTIASIAKQFKGDANEIESFNGVIGNLVPGDEIIIPDGVAQTVAPVVSIKNVTRGTSGSVYDGYYIRPVPGRVTQGLHGYNGVDLGGSVGTPIVAAATGRAIVSRTYGWNGGYGLYVVIDHPNGTQTLYAHMSSVIVSAGSPVVQGQVIGYVGTTGRSTGPHLHFEVRGAKNPFAY